MTQTKRPPANPGGSLSGYSSELYDKTLKGWRRHQTETLADGARPRIEVVWLNPACAEALDRQTARYAAGAGTPLFAEVV